MLKRESPGMEANAAVGIAAWRTILQVAFDGTAYLCKLTAYLMVATGMQRNFKQDVAFRLCNNTIIEHGFLAVWHFSVVGSGRVLFLVSRQPMRKRTFQLRRFVCDNGKISLPDSLVLGKHPVESRQSLACFGKEDDAADGTVQPVDHTEIDVTGLLVLVLQLSLHFI